MAGDEAGEDSQRGSTSLKCPMLTETNYNIWALNYNIREALEPKGQAVDAKKEDMAVALLLQAIPEELVVQVAQYETTTKIREALKTRYIGVDRVREAKIEQLDIEFGSLRMKDSDSVDTFASRISQLVTKAASPGFTYENRKLVRNLLGSFTAKYVQIVSSIEQFAPKDNDVPRDNWKVKDIRRQAERG